MNADEVIAAVASRMRVNGVEWVPVALFGGDTIYPDEVRSPPLKKRIHFFYKGECIAAIYPANIKAVWQAVNADEVVDAVAKAVTKDGIAMVRFTGEVYLLTGKAALTSKPGQLIFLGGAGEYILGCDAKQVGMVWQDP